jgi:hypothetical protein
MTSMQINVQCNDTTRNILLSPDDVIETFFNQEFNYDSKDYHFYCKNTLLAEHGTFEDNHISDGDTIDVVLKVEPLDIELLDQLSLFEIEIDGEFQCVLTRKDVSMGFLLRAICPSDANQTLPSYTKEFIDTKYIWIQHGLEIVKIRDVNRRKTRLVAIDKLNMTVGSVFSALK